MLTAVPGSPFSAGTTPTGIAIDLTSRFVYTTDSVQNQLIAYEILAGGALQPLTNGPFTTGIFPVNLVVDPRDEYLYVSNYNATTISAFTISQATGQPSALAANTFDTGDPGPTCILVDPALGRFVYASLSQFNAVAAAKLNPNTGELTGVQNSPYSVTGTATCVAAVAARQPCHPVRFLNRRPVTSTDKNKGRPPGGLFCLVSVLLIVLRSLLARL